MICTNNSPYCVVQCSKENTVQQAPFSAPDKNGNISIFLYKNICCDPSRGHNIRFLFRHKNNHLKIILKCHLIWNTGTYLSCQHYTKETVRQTNTKRPL